MIEARPGLYPVSKDVKRISKQIENTPVSSRTFDGYCKILGLVPNELENKKILDIGAGNSKFAGGAESYGASVIRLDARYSSGLIGHADKSEKVTAYMQYLPFKDNYFDYSLALYSVNWLETAEDVRKSLLEMIRVTKGSIKISPVYFKSDWEKQEVFGRKLKDEPAELNRRHILPYPAFYQLDIHKDNDLEHDWQNTVTKLVSCLDFNLEAQAQKALKAMQQIYLSSRSDNADEHVFCCTPQVAEGI